MARIKRGTRKDLVRALSERYRDADKDSKGRILDEFTALTGYHRKHASRVLAQAACATSLRRRVAPRSRLYDEAVRQALVVLWEASDRICGKRLKALLPIMISALERHGHLQLDSDVREKLLGVSAATIDRLLAPARAGAGRRRRRRRPAVRAQVPIRTFADWEEPPPGFMEIDLVAHCGGSMAGSFAYTMSMTDIATGWTECVALAVRESSLIAEALAQVEVTLPFPLRGIDTDNGTEFVNETLVAFCKEREIEFTRSRPYHKNDQAWIEQKNGSVVRRLTGYGRLEGITAAESLSRMYASSRLFVNFFQPSFKLLEKTRVGARVRKRYESPKTPAARLLDAPQIDEAIKQRLRAVTVSLDPLRLLDDIRAVQHHLAGLGRGEHIRVVPHRDADLDKFLRGLRLAWKEGDPRPTHQPKPKPPRNWRSRKDPFAEVWSDVVVWLEKEPDRTAKQLFERLQSDHPGDFESGQLRTLQRRVKQWRHAAARRLVFAHVGEHSPASPSA